MLNIKLGKIKFLLQQFYVQNLLNGDGHDVGDPKRVDTDKAKEFFTIELDHANNTLTFIVNGKIMNVVKYILKQNLYLIECLKIAKFKFLK